MFSIEKYNTALRFAGQWHKGQLIPGADISYLLHLSMVAQCALRGALAEKHIDVDLVLQAALLHDVLEDTDCSYQEVETHFGRAVAQGVLALSKTSERDGVALSKEQQMDDSLHRIKQQPKEIAMVKLADRISNLGRPPYHWFHRDRKIEAYCAEAQKIGTELGWSSSFLLQMLEQRVATYGQYIQRRAFPLIRCCAEISGHEWQNIRVVGQYQAGNILLSDGALTLNSAENRDLEGKEVLAFGTLHPKGEYAPLLLFEKVGLLPLEEAYRQTSYCAEGFALHIDQRDPQFEQFLRKNRVNSWCFVTASNPQSQSLTPAENHARNQHFGQRLKSAGYVFFRALGVPHTDLWEPEHSFLVLGISLDDAVGLGREYGQKAILYGQLGTLAQLHMLS